LTTVVHEHLLASTVFLTHGQVELSPPESEQVAELAILIAGGFSFLVLLPEEHQRQVLVRE
jgi:hypothetical protein